MTRYLLGIYQPDTGEVPDDLDDIMRSLEALNDEMRAAGVWVFAAGLHPPASSTVVHPGPDALITDGPYIEAKEHIGGFTVIEVADLDEALAWTRKLVAVLRGLAVEVRPIAEG